MGMRNVHYLLLISLFWQITKNCKKIAIKYTNCQIGVLAVKAKRITDGMLMAASHALAECSPLATAGDGALLPQLEEIEKVSRHIAFYLGKAAMADGVAETQSDDQLLQSIDATYWYPQYRMYKKKK